MMATEHGTAVVAGFESPDQARVAMRKAGLSGIDGDHMRLDRPPSSVRPRRHGVDRRLTRWVSRRVLAYSIAVAVVSGVIALVVASVVVTNSSTRWQAVSLAALAGLVVGFVLGGISAFPLTPALTDTFEDDQGAVRLVVHASSLDEAKAAEEALQAAGAVWINRRP